jgi:hypothetical protein
MEKIQRKYRQSNPHKGKTRIDGEKISLEEQKNTLEEAFSGTYIAVELEMLLNKKSLASKLTEKDMDVDIQAIFRATEKKF